VLAAGCTATTVAPPSIPEPPVASPFQSCPPSTPPGRGPLAVAVPCFAGDTTVAIAGLGKPSVINLWASWCGPCREELPEFQRFADAAGDRVVVLGVVTDDRRAAAASLAVDLGITFPTVYDPNGTVRIAAKAQKVLPVTLFVDASGVVVHQDLTGKLTSDQLRSLARQHLGVELE
jgi:thiol-disulfide isomerase/thioredoxin